MLYNVQVLRAVASLLVVHAHAAAGGLNLAWVGGANGVDLFFVISGFIIAYVADTDSSQFMTRRLIRIVPIYWVSTLGLYALVVLVPHLFRSTSSDPVLLVKSLLFIPDGSTVHTEDGLPHPTLNGGWTLNYEMYFYVMFWIALSIKKKYASAIAIGMLAVVIIVVNATALDDYPVAHFYGYPIVLEFVFGIVAFHLVRAAEHSRLRQIAPAVQRIVLLAIVVAGLLSLAFARELYGATPRYLASGIPSFFVVTAAVLLEKLHGWKVTNKLAVMVGDASYVLYLLHAYIVFGITRLIIGKRTFSEPVGQLIVVGLIVISAAIAVVVYRYFEVPMLKRLKRLVLARRSKPAT